ncbi:sensor histidine kinase [Roseateles violae]|uniref:Histidine kinase n=1 Tax=Roseateles violae TaxID=3058042 RepID=A0ABT8DPM2_9BURK|nr:histidine kinase [Pelomonas sp. PFR6]MDN3918889.1 histidine kinase [Pelomonas sp. PFR6]
MQETRTSKLGGNGGLDWSQWLYPGPRRLFSAEEMARAGGQPWPRAVDGYVLSNVLLLVALNGLFMPRSWFPGMAAGMLSFSWLALRVARWLWRRPTRLNLNLATLGTALLLLPLALWLRGNPEIDHAGLKHPAVMALTVLVAVLSSWWFLTLYRVQQIEARLRELDERERGLQLARRLAAAQIQPHFLFNTLASLQHWVDTRDERAATTLRAFTRYLRATLPMFERETLSLVEELQIVRSYLDIMQARLGTRLAWAIDAEPALDSFELPPGTLLTLVENAIAHGIEPALRGGRIDVRAARKAGRVVLEVADDGAGLCEEPAPETGIGLVNTRARLQQQFGARAALTLAPQTPGCLARIEIGPE